MTYDREKHNRRSIRLRGYDYTQPGAYFVTIVAQGRLVLFGEVVKGEMMLNEYGNLVQFTWDDLVNHVSGVELGAFVVMPNHVHGIIEIVGDPIVGAGSEPAPTEPAPTEPAPTATVKTKQHTLSEIVRQFKTFSARRINTARGTPGAPVWQRNYYEHVIRDQTDLDAVQRYIEANPSRWEDDAEYIR